MFGAFLYSAVYDIAERELAAREELLRLVDWQAGGYPVRPEADWRAGGYP